MYITKGKVPKIDCRQLHVLLFPILGKVSKCNCTTFSHFSFQSLTWGLNHFNLLLKCRKNVVYLWKPVCYFIGKQEYYRL
jgi:hypothetical protein